MHPDMDRMDAERLLVMFWFALALVLAFVDVIAALSTATPCRDLCAVLDLELVVELPCKCVCSDPVDGHVGVYDRDRCADTH